MRTEQEMYELILNTAREDDRIRAVYMNGSRTNENAPRDIFQDYDVVYVVTENRPFYTDRGWIDRFGKRLYMQCPDEMDALRGEEVDFDACYGWLIQFADGNRLDLHVEPVERNGFLEDKLCRILLDKDGILTGMAEPTDEDYWVRKPAEGEFLAVCNEFWWCTNNVAKGLFRDEIPYVQDMLNFYVRTQLVKLLEWKVGILTDFTVSCGKSGKYMYRWLPKQVWGRFLQTWCGPEQEEIWEAVFLLCDLFAETAEEVSGQLGYTYNSEEAENARMYLAHVRRLPKDAKEVFVELQKGVSR